MRGRAGVRTQLSIIGVLAAITAVLAGCGHSPSEPGWLATDSNTVIYAQWTEQPDGAVSGTGKMVEVATGVADPYTLVNHELTVAGIRKGKALELAVGVDATKVQWTGSVDGPTVVLEVPGPTGTQSYTFHKADTVAYAKAATGLGQLMKSQAAAADRRGQLLAVANAAQQAAAAQRQKEDQARQAEQQRQNKAVDDANAAIRTALARLDTDTKVLASVKFDPATVLQPVDSAYKDLQAAAAAVDKDAGAGLCANATADLVAVGQRYSAVLVAMTTFDDAMHKLSGQIETLNASVGAAQSALNAFPAVAAQNPEGQLSSPAIAGADVDAATAAAGKLTVDHGVAAAAATTTAEADAGDAGNIKGRSQQVASRCTTPTPTTAAAAAQVAATAVSPAPSTPSP